MLEAILFAEQGDCLLIDHIHNVAIISRNRGAEYIKGATEGAPQAKQCADCWHLIKNLSDALERFLYTKVSCLQVVQKSDLSENERIDAP